MLGFLPFLQFLFGEEQPEQGLSEMVPKQMPCPTVGDITPLRGDQVRELGLWSEWLFYWKPREKGWTPINTHVIPETHTAMQTHTSKSFRVCGAEWMGANGALLNRTGKFKKSSSGARGATRQHTVNPKTVLMLHSMCVRNFPFQSVNHKKRPCKMTHEV